MDYWYFIESYWDQAGFGEDDKFLRNFPALPEGARHLLATHWLVSEVCNGGFHQFFHNWTGLLAPEAVQGLGAIGLSELQAIAAEAMSFFGANYPRGDTDRRAALENYALRYPEGAERAQWDPFGHLDDRFYASLALPDGGGAFQAAADAYAASVSGEAGKIPGSDTTKSPQ